MRMNTTNKELSWVVLGFMIFVIFIQMWSSSDGCLDTERIALLEIKSAFNSPYSYPFSSWVLNANCCSWKWIECDPSTGRVMELDLDSARDWNLGDWYLNASLFLPFQQLKTLDLFYNQIVGCIKNEGFEKLLKLENLEVLNLGGNKFSNNIISSLTALSSLKSLYLYDNILNGTLNIEASLELLDIEDNEIEGSEEVLKLSNLEYLDLSFNNFNNSILPSLSGLSSLKHLYIDHNQLKGVLNLKELDHASRKLEDLSLSENQIEKIEVSRGSEEVLKLSNLEYLGLSYNNFNNSILPSLSGLSSLKRLFIDHNPLKGVLNLKELEASSKLEELSLGGNQIEKIEGLRDMKALTNLRLSDMVIEGKSMLLESLGALPNLKTLYLLRSNLRGRVIGEGSYNLSNMEELYLEKSSLDEKSLQSFGEISSLKRLSLIFSNGSIPSKGWDKFKNLELLELQASTFDDGGFLQTIGMMTSLKTLSLFYCKLNGTIPAHQGLCQLKHLRKLDLMYNDLSGSLPLCLANLTSLQTLFLSSNHLVGKISPLTSLTSLQLLHLSDNLLQIPISLSTFFNQSKLKYLYVGGNKIYADTEDHTSVPKFQLDRLQLDGNGNVGASPKFLYYQQNLQYIDLSNLRMEGQFPYWLLENNTKLQSLSLANNSLSGSLQLPIHPHMNLKYLDISANHFHSYIPKEIGTYFSRLISINISQNGFSGSIPSSFGNMSSLESLDLSNNELSGRILEENANLEELQDLYLGGNQLIGNIPNSLSNSTWLRTLDISDNKLSGNIQEWMENMYFLEVLDLTQNNISGNLPSSFNSPNMEQIYLSRNKLHGSLASAFCNCTKLMTLDISHNLLNGSIPAWIGRLSELSILLLNYNNLVGQIPIELCKLVKLSLINLSHNNLSGPILHCLKCSSMLNVQLEDRNFSTDGSSIALPPGQQPVEFTTKSNLYSYQGTILTYFSGIDLSCNNFTGQIPSEIGHLSKIQVLNLSHNYLTGPIPPTISNLFEIESLDLSNNNLQGKLPPQLTNLYYLSVFNVSYNNLSGKTPDRVAQFATFDESSYKGNPSLCGWPLPKTCDETESPSLISRTSPQNDEGNDFMDMDVFSISFGIAYVMVLLGIAAVLYINPYWRRVWFYYIQVSMENCYYFIIDNLYYRFKFYRLCK